MISDHIEGNSSFARVGIIPYTLRSIVPVSSCIGIMLSESIVLSGYNFFDEINRLLPTTHICIRNLELHVGCRVTVAIRLSKNYNNESSIWQLWNVTSWLF